MRSRLPAGLRTALRGRPAVRPCGWAMPGGAGRRPRCRRRLDPHPDRAPPRGSAKPCETLTMTVSEICRERPRRNARSTARANAAAARGADRIDGDRARRGLSAVPEEAPVLRPGLPDLDVERRHPADVRRSHPDDTPGWRRHGHRPLDRAGRRSSRSRIIPPRPTFPSRC